MNKTLIWVGVGIVGVALAALLVPWGRLGTSPTPEILVPELPPPTAASATPAAMPSAPAPSTSGPRADGPSTASTEPVAPTGDDAASDAPKLSSARQEFAELQKRPDMKLVSMSEMKWQAIDYNMANKPRDPAADGAIERSRKLRQKMQAYQRDPNAYDINELMAEQEHILGELRQTQYWDKEFQAIEADLEAEWQTYRDESGAKHPYR
jgi:hypothetical protein